MNTYGLKKLTPNPNNPRVLRDDQYKKLLASIKRDPEFLSKRPIVHAEGVILGGNMRYRALLEATKDPEFRAKIGTTKEGEVPEGWVLDASEFSEEQRRRFVIVDNAPKGMSGDWDWDVLGNEWDDMDLGGLGLDIHINNFEDEWVGMPSCNNEDLSNHPQVIINFETSIEKINFGNLIGKKITEKTKSIWYPEMPEKLSDQLGGKQKLVYE